MQCPRIWNARQPTVKETLVECKPSSESIDLLSSRHFNHSVSVSVPDTTAPPDSLLASILHDSDYYRVRNLRAHQLLSDEFVQAFVKKGAVYLLAINRKLDIHSSLALTPTGVLVLSLTKEDYERLGLAGKPMKHKLLPRYGKCSAIN